MVLNGKSEIFTVHMLSFNYRKYHTYTKRTEQYKKSLSTTHHSVSVTVKVLPSLDLSPGFPLPTHIINHSDNYFVGNIMTIIIIIGLFWVCYIHEERIEIWG